MSHPNAVLTPRHRMKVARLVVDDGWPISEVAARFQVSWPTVKRWNQRPRSVHLALERVVGQAGLAYAVVGSGAGHPRPAGASSPTSSTPPSWSPPSVPRSAKG